MMPEVDSFLTSWIDDENKVKPLFNQIYEYLGALSDVTCNYKERPGISYSLRAKHINQNGRDLFVLVDLIDDEPSARWLSICFYADLVTDSEERGDVVPGGLMGEDAHCFDIDSVQDGITHYIMERLKEAYSNAGITQ